MTTDAVPRHQVGTEGLPWLVARALGALSLARIAEVATVAFLGAFLAGRFPRRR
jgi:hypothetical protein